MVENFQRAVAEHAKAGRLLGTELSLVAGALHQAGIPASADLTAAVESSIEDMSDISDMPRRRGLAETDRVPSSRHARRTPSCSSALSREAAHAYAASVSRTLAAALTVSPSAVAREAAVLMLLDPDPEIRAAVASILESQPASISPTSVRRLIAMRNWRPQAERVQIDKIVRAARAKGIDCAAWDAGGADEILVERARRLRRADEPDGVAGGPAQAHVLDPVQARSARCVVRASRKQVATRKGVCADQRRRWT